ncbi:MAG: ATP-binding protein, partial [Clostridia bacterium]
MENKISHGELAEDNDLAISILKHCNVQYWTYNPVNNKGVTGANAMSELGALKTWDDFPERLINMGLIHESSAEEWLQMHEKIKNGEARVTGEIRVVEEGIPLWKKIQYFTSFDDSGKPISATGMAENITVYKNLAENYAKAANQCGVTLWMLDFDSKTIYDFSNATQLKAFDGVKVIRNVPDVFEGDGSLLHPDDLQAFRDMFARIFKGEERVKSEGRWWNEELNCWWWYEIGYITTFDSDGKPQKAIGTAVNITERIRLEERYNEEIKWRKVHNQDILGSFKMNLTQNTCEEGQSDIKTILTFGRGGTVDGFFELEYATHLDAAEAEQYKSIFNRENLLKEYQRGKTSFIQESYVDFGENKILWIKIELDMFQNPKNGDVEAYIYAMDIDQRKVSRALVDVVVNMDYDYLALLDIITGGYTLFAQTDSHTSLPPFHSSSYEHEVQEYAKQFLVDEDIENNIHDMSYKNVLAKLKTQDVFTTYCRVKESDGSIRRKRLQFSYLDEPRKKIILTRTDITDVYNEEKRKNDALKDALMAAQQANSAKSEFLSRMSHEIRTPMNTIIGMSALAASCVNDPVQVSEYLSKVGISARFLLSLINDILDMSRIESGKVLIRHETIPFEEFINGINSISYSQAQQKGVEYDAIITSFTEEEYIGDAMKLQQVIINIISNAIKFTPEGGKVQLVVHQGKISHGEAPMRFTVNDTGIGISDEFMPQLFEPFEQAHTGATTPYSGTGLGLAICKNLINLMGGKISVNSIEGVGSEFVVEVKLGVPENSEQSAKLKNNVHLENLKALIV